MRSELHTRTKGALAAIGEGDEDADEAIRLAMNDYWRQGMSSLSLSEVCRRAGISKPALYREFGGEDGLMAAVLDHYREQFVEPLLVPFAEDRPVGALIEGAITRLTSDRGTPAGCLFTKMRLASSRLGPLASERVRVLERTQRDTYEAWYRRGLANGDANPDLSPKLAARYLDTQFATILVQMDNGVAPELVRDQARLALQALKAPSNAPQ